MSVPAQVRQAEPDDRAAVLATVVAAFAGDPGWTFLFDGENDRVAPLFAGALFDLRCPRGSVWVTEDLAAVAMWDRPEQDAPLPVPAEEIWARYAARAGEQASVRLAAYSAAVSAASTPPPHFYLGVLATQPARRGQGLASAVMEPEMARAEEAGMACCLETSTLPNRRFYEKRGFTEATEVELAGGPATWWLRRPAR
jgi:GNAT superfamily N-acetyltransferase